VWAWDDRGAFKRLENGQLFDRLSKEANVAGFAPADPSSDDASDVVARLPSRVVHLIAAGVPLPVAKQIADLARKSGFGLDDGPPDAQQLELLFRTGADGNAQLVSVTFPGAKGDTTFYRFRSSPDAQPEFFDALGQSVSKTLLRKPVANGRLGDGFAWRLHPILRRWLHHNGIDYAAPYGSPIVAAGDGTVAIIGHEWGYGKYVRIRHDAGYFTTYAHISGVPPTLKVGQRVRQGQVIAYIGSTGLSTGPHLYYELRIGGRYYDPLKADLPAGTRLTGALLEDFRSQMNHIGCIDRYIDSETAKGDTSRTMTESNGKQATTNFVPDPG
jgi:murein DD-endopeptidase MepM/ murein hydrolase activator NlpD